MPRRKKGHIVIGVLPVDAMCRVKGCHQYGKITRRIDRHINDMHNMTRIEHDKLPACSFTDVKKEVMKKGYMKYRRPEKCYVPGCRKLGQHFVSLTKHLRTVHGLTRKQYKERRILEQKRKASNKLKIDFILSYLSSEGGCPATRDERYPHDRSNIPVKDLQSNCFPKFVFITIYTESCQLAIISDTIKTYSLPDDEPHCVTYHAKKLLVSASHQEWFKESIEEASATVTKGKEPDELLYFCSLCPYQHVIKLIAVPSLVPS